MTSNLRNKEIMGANINAYLFAKGKSKKDMCDALGFKYSTVFDWCRGKTYPRINKIEMMAEYFGITKADLVEPRMLNPKTGHPEPLKDAKAKTDRSVYDDLFAQVFNKPEVSAIAQEALKMNREELQAVLLIMQKMNASNSADESEEPT